LYNKHREGMAASITALFSYFYTTIKESEPISGLLSFSDYFIVRGSNSNTTISLCSSLIKPPSSTK
ncbi:hypothetical protein, partial [Lysinibacillus sp. D4B1_S16]|uniref:hypothetical protein n=1 Tax=Lysinibacillus sp. D4B1_S16 TaxID=2941231 RepID=UPI0020C18785